MECPVCKTKELQMTERQGIEVDYCPQCRGVWLDRGELDKIIERSQDEMPPPQPQPTQAPPPGRDYGHGYSEPYRGSDDRYRGGDDRYRGDDRGHYKKHKRKSLLSEIFDF